MKDHIVALVPGPISRYVGSEDDRCAVTGGQSSPPDQGPWLTQPVPLFGVPFQASCPLGLHTHPDINRPQWLFGTQSAITLGRDSRPSLPGREVSAQ